MMGRTHLAIGLLTVLLLFSFVAPAHPILFIILVMIGSILPDVDHSGSTINRMVPFTRWIPYLFEHRGFFHSVFPPLVMVILASLLGHAWFGGYLMIGYLSHLLSDACTHMGVNFFYPFSRFQAKGFMKTGGIMEFFLLIGVGVLDCWLIVRSIW